MDSKIIENLPKLNNGDKVEIILGNYNGKIGKCNIDQEKVNNLKNILLKKKLTNYNINCKKYYYKNIMLICSDKNRQYYKRTPIYSDIGDNIAVNINNIKNVDQYNFPIVQKYDCIKIEKITNYNYNESNGKFIISIVEENFKGNIMYFIKLILYDMKKISDNDKKFIDFILKEIS